MLLKRRYKILCPKQIKDPITPEKATEKILEHTGLDAESFRLGKTKVDHACHTCTRPSQLFFTFFACIHNQLSLIFLSTSVL